MQKKFFVCSALFIALTAFAGCENKSGAIVETTDSTAAETDMGAATDANDTITVVRTDSSAAQEVKQGANEAADAIDHAADKAKETAKDATH